MFGILFLKEWKEKFGIFAFGTGLLALSLLAYLGLPKNQNVHDLLVGGLLILFFPFMALLLGAGGFEPESRNDAWAYLFSRPVGKGFLWAVKYLSLLSVLASLWLVFLGIMTAVPGIRTLVEGFRLPFLYGSDISFLPWSLLASLFYLTVAFSLSIFSGKWSYILFAALFISLALAFLAKLEATFVLTVLRNERFNGDKWLHVFRWGIILMAAAFAGASVLTLVRADFSQPRKKIARFINYAAPFLIGAVIISAAWTSLLPRTADRSLWLTAKSNGEIFFSTEEGIFKYNPDKDKVTRLAKAVVQNFGLSSIQNGKIAYLDIDRRTKEENPLVLRIMNFDGSENKRLVGGGFKPEDPRSRIRPWMFALSPDGKQIALIDESRYQKSSKSRSLLWSMNTDGTDLKNHAVDPAMIEGGEWDYWLNIAAWTRSKDALLIVQMARRSGLPSRLWLYDLKDGISRVVFEFDSISWRMAVSPGGDYLAVPFKRLEGDKSRLAVALFDLNSLEITKIEVDDDRSIARLTWSSGGDKLAFFARKETSQGTGVYVLTVVSIAARKLLASKKMTKEENIGMLYALDWLKDGLRLILKDSRGDKCLKILGPDLSEEKNISFPASIRTPIDLMVSGDKVLVDDDATHTLWRLDLRTESWKKIY